MDYRAEYQRWLEQADDELKIELRSMDEAAIEDAFYRNLCIWNSAYLDNVPARTA
jgi:phosphoglucomutase